MKHAVPWFALFVMAGWFSGCGGHNESPEKTATVPVVKATVAAVEKQPVQTPYEAVGTVRAAVSSTIQSKLLGHVRTVHVREGSTVEAGQPLVEVDSREADSQVQQAQSLVREAENAQRETASVLQAARHAQEAAEANAALAKTTFERHQRMLEKQAVSRQAFDEAETKWKAAEAEVARAKETALSLVAKQGEAEARVAQANAGVDQAKTMLSYAVLTAPFPGIVTRKTVDAGDLAAPGTPLLVVDDPRQYRLEALVDEAHAPGVALGAKVTVHLDAANEDLTGVVSELTPAADPVTRSSVIKVDLPPHPALRSGIFGRARFASATEPALTAPATALYQRGQLTGVFVVGAGDTARLRLVTVGKRFGEALEILSGLEPGERIVVNNVVQVTDGATVRPE